MFGNVLQTVEEDHFNKNKESPNVNYDRMEAGYNGLFAQEDESVLDSYWAVRGEREELDHSPSSEMLKSTLHDKEAEDINLGIQEAILDPTRSMEDRAAISQLQVDRQRQETPLSVKLGQKLAIADNDIEGVPATDEQEEIRALYASSLMSQMAYREMQQSVMDDAKFSESGLGLLTDMAQLMVPFVEQSNVAEALTKVGLGEESMAAFFMQGNQKQVFFDAFKAMPTNVRITAIKKWAKIAHEANTTAFMTNGLLEQQMMQELVYGGNYGEGARYLDNFVGWVDLTVFAKPAAWVAKTVQKIAKAGKSIRQLRALEATISTQEAGAKLLRQMKIDGVRTKISPVSPIRVAADTNTESGKAMFFAVVEDATEEAAGAFGATSKVDVVGDSLMPELHLAREVVIKEAKAELLGFAGEKLSRGVQKDLRKLRKGMVSKLSRVEPTTVKDVGVRSDKGISARKAKSDAVKRAAAASAAERQSIQDVIDHIDLQLRKSSKGAQAEADLSRLEQGIIPKRFQKAAVEGAVEVVEEVPVGAAIPTIPEFHKAFLTDGVRNKIHNIDANIEKSRIQSQKIVEALDESAVNSLTRAEMESASAHEVDNLKDVIGLASRDNMFQHTNTPTGARISGVYGHADNGWSSATEAFDQAGVALRAHGVDRSNMYLLERLDETGEYIRVDEATGKDFLVGVDFDYQVKFSDVMNWDKLSVHKNFLDTVPLLAKHAINRHFWDPASILDPQLFLGANARVDKSAQITQDFLEVGKKFSDGFGKASKESQASMYKYILEANEQQIPFNINTLRGDYGFSSAEIKTLRDFREYWDTVWEARNVTDIRALRNQGFGVYANNKGDNLFAKPVAKAQVSRGNIFYDPATGLTKHMDEVGLQKLYDDGHTIGKLRRPIEVGGKNADQMILKNDSGWRALNDSDKAYPYRHGYFQRIYNKPHFVVKQGFNVDGSEYWRAVATADTVDDANVYIKKLAKTDSEGVYKHRPDVKDPREQGSFEMDTFESSGMSMQRVRGDKLIDSTAVVRGTEDANVLSPVDAIISSSRSMGRKVAMSDFIQAAKGRFMAQYADQLPLVKGQRRYPRTMDEIGATGDATSKAAADARSTYEYISFLEYGYISSVDNVYKTILKSLASRFGERGFRGTEIALEKASEVAPTSFAKNLAFQMYIASNPLRQAALNAHQSVLLTAKFPKYVASQRLAADMHAFMYMRMNIKVPKAAIKLTGRTEGELKLMWKQYQKSGLSASIDQHNMIRGSLMDMVEASKFKGNLVTKGLGQAQRFGFNLGEEVNLNSSWLSHYDAAAKTKKFLDASDFDRIAGNARNFTFNMNRAGDMPYNANALSLFFQYMQVPHKSLLQMSNRALTGAERTSLGMYNLTMFTLPPAAMYDWFGDVLPDAQENPELHEAIVSGFEFYIFNKMAELASGDHVSVDFGNLAPSDAYGLYDFMRSMLTTELGEIIAHTPSGQLFAGSNPRITKLFKTIVSYVTPDDTQGMSPTTLSNVFRDLAALSSGMSNLFKAKMALEHHKAYGNRGQVLDPSVSTPEAILMAFGFKTMDSARATWVGMELYEKSSEYTKDVSEWYKQLTMKLASEGGRADTDEYITTVTSMAFLAFGSSKKAHSIIARNLDRDTLAGKGAIYDSILRRAEVLTGDELRTVVNSAPDWAGKEDAVKAVNAINRYKEEE